MVKKVCTRNNEIQRMTMKETFFTLVATAAAGLEALLDVNCGS